jgi:predicted HNH restriction endonuclease
VNESNKHHFCSKECQAKNGEYRPSGEDHWHYIDGNTSYKRGSNWLEQRRVARERDGYTCQRCGLTEQQLGKALDVHHMKPYRLFDDYAKANTLDNLVSLCPSCHHRQDALLVNE